MTLEGLPIARWKGYGGETDFHGSILETITWAVGAIAAKYLLTFAEVSYEQEVDIPFP